MNTVNSKLTDTQLQKLKNVVKIRTGTTLRISLKMFNGNDLLHELLLTTRQKTKSKYAFNNNMSTDIKLSKVQISKIIQFGWFLGSLLSKLAGQLMKVAVTWAKDILAPSKFRRKRYEIQDCEDYQPCRMFLKEELAVTIMMETRTTKAVEFKAKFKINQHKPISTTEQ